MDQERSVVLAFERDGNERDEAERDRLITKGKGVLDLCIQQNKLLCVLGFVDSQIERGGVYVEVVRAMRDYIAAELTAHDGDRSRKRMLRDLHDYVASQLDRGDGTGGDTTETEPAAALGGSSANGNDGRG